MKLKAVSGIMLTLLLIGMLTLALNNQPLKAEPTPVVSVYPPTSTAEVGETFTVNIIVTEITEEDSLYLWECRITFNPDIINAVNATEGPFLKDTGCETFWAKEINNTTGRIDILAMISEFPYPPNGAAGSGTLATVTFEAVGQGETDLELHAWLSAIKGEAPGQYVIPIEHTTEGGFFTNAPPPIIHVSPSQAPIGSKINISGEEFPSKQDVSITFEDLSLCCVTTGENGEFDATLFVPVVDSGNYTIKAMLTYPYQVAMANASFTVTLGVDNLLLQYAYLNSSYNELKSDYDGLKSKHDALTSDLGTTRNLSYVFIMTTIVFIATTVYLATRKPRRKPELKST
jgi:hypothetical protein